MARKTTTTATASISYPAMTRGQIRMYLAYFCAFGAQERPDVKSPDAETAVARWRDEALKEAYQIATSTSRDAVEEMFCGWWQAIKSDAMDVIGQDFARCERGVMYARNPSGRRSHRESFGHRPDPSAAEAAIIRARARALEATFSK